MQYVRILVLLFFPAICVPQQYRLGNQLKIHLSANQRSVPLRIVVETVPHKKLPAHIHISYATGSMAVIECTAAEAAELVRSGVIVSADLIAPGRQLLND